MRCQSLLGFGPEVSTKWVNLIQTLARKTVCLFTLLVPHSNAVFGASIKIKTRLQQGEAIGAQREYAIPSIGGDSALVQERRSWRRYLVPERANPSVKQKNTPNT